MTLQQVHEARMEHNRLIAERKALDRRLAHEQKEAREKLVADQKKAAARRRIVTNVAVPYLFASRPDLFAAVMAELNLSAGQQNSNENASSDLYSNDTTSTTQISEQQGDDITIKAQYRSVYLDSIPSFVERLSSDPALVAVDPLDDSFSGGLSYAEHLLDALADAGFDDSQFTKHHRMHSSKKGQYHRYLNRVRTKLREADGRRRKLAMFQVNLDSAEQRLAEVEEELVVELENSRGTDTSASISEGKGEPDGVVVPTSALQLIRDGVTKLFGLAPSMDLPTPNTDSKVAVGDGDDESNSSIISPAEIRLRRRLRKTLKKVEKQRNGLRQVQLALAGSERQLEKLKSEKEKYKPPLTDEEYNKAGTVAGRILQTFCPALADHLHDRHAKLIEQYRIVDAQTDLTKPHEWYPRARLDRRKIIYHGGPTNSGKTWQALQVLKQADKGLYLGPLRLLAAEVYESLNSQGVYCNLWTGQEKKEIPFATHASATVELAPLDRDFDVVVIDEIQMIADPFRGWAWTRALLGLRCKEIHVAGGLEGQILVEKLAKVCGDEFELNQYERFTDLEVAKESLSRNSNSKNAYSKVQPGDCVVCFSRNDIFAIKREIEKTTDHKCCVIYGSLPPQTRSDQARRFNDPNSGYDVLVASDAIGMGLNLNIRRIIFNSMFKSNGENIVQLDHSSVKQISGRAGRRNSPFPNGKVTCRDPVDMNHLRKCMGTEIRPLTKAGLLPTSAHFELFAAATQRYDVAIDPTNLHQTLLQFGEMARLKGDYFLCRQSELRLTARWLDDLPLEMTDKYNFCMAPVNQTCHRSMQLLKQFATKYRLNEMSGIHHRKFIPKKPRSLEDLSALCSKHNQLELFLWLSWKFPSNANMIEQLGANSLKDETIAVINDGLSNASSLTLSHDYLRRDRNLRATYAKEREKRSADDDEAHGFGHDFDAIDDMIQQFTVEDI